MQDPVRNAMAISPPCARFAHNAPGNHSTSVTHEPNMLFLHPKIFLAADPIHTTDALLVENGRITAIGAEAKQLGGHHEIVKPGGVCLFPALADAHVHLWGLGIRAGTVDLRGMSVSEIYEALEAAERHSSGWLLGVNWDENIWTDGSQLQISELDRRFPNTPVYLRRVDFHALQVNSKALEIAQIGPTYDCGSDGRVGRDSAGNLSGLLIDKAMEPINRITPALTAAEDRAVFEETATMLKQFGIASAHMAWVSVERLSMLQEMHAEKSLPIRVYAMIDGLDDALPEVLARGPLHDGDGWLSMRALKFFADGALGSRGARLLEPYLDGSYGIQIHGDNELAARTKLLMESGWQVAIHAIGDYAVREVLDAFQTVNAQVRKKLRPRLEHAQMVSPEDCIRFETLQTIASIQPAHLRSDVVWVNESLRQDQISRLFPWRQLAPYTTFAAGSDYPIDDPNPWHGISAAIMRRDANGCEFSVDQALTRREILGAYTRGAAFAAHWDGILGELRPGFAADIIALDRDPFTETGRSIGETKVEAMWLGGVPVNL